MEAIKQAHENFVKALATLDEALHYKPPVVDEKLENQLRDSRIQRFEYCIDSFWKFAKKYLLLYHALDLNTPKTVFKGLFKAKVSTEQETEMLLDMIDIRNKTSHMYFEEIATQLDRNLNGYFQLIKKISFRMSQQISQEAS